ncbi:putative alpha beta hydrolase [Phaeomoniella chlamydospora]|uniref:Putative alpha beta hydrolase n=1 Tax=Phaeomoniella chlamydospora TaxID=158046 RepID=A0A0G2DSP3_PHACM|nr:putative alpha beta hydrolase [Phaeomoniella chlamydospora]
MGGGLTIFYHLLTLLSSSPSASNSAIPYLPANFVPPRFAGIILDAPWIALPPSSTPSTLKVVAGRLAAKILPRFQLPNKFDPKFVSRNPQVCEDWAKDDLCHDTVTLEGAAGMLDRHGELESLSKGKPEATTFAPLYSTTVPSTHSSKFHSLSQTPILILHGDGDLVTSYHASKALFASPSDTNSINPLPFLPPTARQFKTYEGGYHKLHADQEGTEEDFADDVGAWILKILDERKIKNGNGKAKDEENGKRDEPTTTTTTSTTNLDISNTATAKL